MQTRSKDGRQSGGVTLLAPTGALVSPDVARRLQEGLGRDFALALAGAPGAGVAGLMARLCGLRVPAKGSQQGSAVAGGIRHGLPGECGVSLLQVPLSASVALEIWDLSDPRRCAAAAASRITLAAVVLCYDPSKPETLQQLLEPGGTVDQLREAACTGAVWALMGLDAVSSSSTEDVASMASREGWLQIGTAPSNGGYAAIRSGLLQTLAPVFQEVAKRAAAGDIQPHWEGVETDTSDGDSDSSDLSVHSTPRDKEPGRQSVARQHRGKLAGDTLRTAAQAAGSGSTSLAAAATAPAAHATAEAGAAASSSSDGGLPFGGDLAAAMRAQDRGAIRAIMAHRKSALQVTVEPASSSHDRFAGDVPSAAEENGHVIHATTPKGVLVAGGLSEEEAEHAQASLFTAMRGNGEDVADVSGALDVVKRLTSSLGRLPALPPARSPVAKVASTECGICFTDVEPADWRLGCGAHSFCGDCLSRHICVLLDERGLLPGCPSPSCDMLFSEGQAEAILKAGDVQTEAPMRRFRLLSLRAGLANLGAMPCPACDEWMVPPDEAEGRQALACPSCGELLCSLCRHWPHHFRCGCEEVAQVLADWEQWLLTGQQEYFERQGAVYAKALEESKQRQQEHAKAVEEAQRRRREFEEMESWKVANCKLCPGCKRPIEKTGGCDSMRCGQDFHGGNAQGGCGTQFSWNAAKPYVKQEIVDHLTVPKFVNDEGPKVEPEAAWLWEKEGEPLRCDVCRDALRGPRFVCVHCPAFECCILCAGKAGGLSPSRLADPRSKRSGRLHRVGHAFMILWSPPPGDNSVVLAQEGPLLKAAERIERRKGTEQGSWISAMGLMPEVEQLCPSNYDPTVVMAAILAAKGEELQTAQSLLGNRPEVQSLVGGLLSIVEAARQTATEQSRAGLSTAAEAPEEDSDEEIVKPFVPADTFIGPKGGYVFTRGPFGVGYYLDECSQQGNHSRRQPDGDARLGSEAAASEDDPAAFPAPRRVARRRLAPAHIDLVAWHVRDLDQQLRARGAVVGLTGALYDAMAESEASSAPPEVHTAGVGGGAASSSSSSSAAPPGARGGDGSTSDNRDAFARLRLTPLRRRNVADATIQVQLVIPVGRQTMSDPGVSRTPDGGLQTYPAPETLLADWNEQHPEQRIAFFDEVLEINGRPVQNADDELVWHPGATIDLLIRRAGAVAYDDVVTFGIEEEDETSGTVRIEEEAEKFEVFTVEGGEVPAEQVSARKLLSGAFELTFLSRVAGLTELAYATTGKTDIVRWRVEASRTAVGGRKARWEVLLEHGADMDVPQERGAKVRLSLQTPSSRVREAVLRAVRDRGQGGVLLWDLCRDSTVEESMVSMDACLGLAPGSHVKLQGLTNKELNGSLGTLQDFDQQSQRWPVQLWLSGQVYKIKEEKLVRQLESPMAFLEGFVRRELHEALMVRRKDHQLRVFRRCTELVPMQSWNYILWGLGVDWDDETAEMVRVHLDPKNRGAILVADVQATLDLAERRAEEEQERAVRQEDEQRAARLNNPHLIRSRSALRYDGMEPHDLTRVRSSLLVDESPQPELTRSRSAPYKDDIALSLCLGGMRLLKVRGAVKRGTDGTLKVPKKPSWSSLSPLRKKQEDSKVDALGLETRTVRLCRAKGWALLWTTAGTGVRMLAHMSRRMQNMVETRLPLDDVVLLRYGWSCGSQRAAAASAGLQHTVKPWLCFSLLTAKRGYDFVASTEQEAENWVLTLAQCLGDPELGSRRRIRIARCKLKLREQHDLAEMLRDAIAKTALERRIPFAWKA